MATSTAWRMAAICGSVRSTGRLSDVAPRSSRSRAAAGFGAASVTEVLSTKSGGRSPVFFMRPSSINWPRSATRIELTPSVTPWSTSSMPNASWSAPRSDEPTTRPARAGRLDADIPVRPRPDEQAHFDAVPPAERDHLADLVVGLEHDAAALADAVNHHAVTGRALQHGVHRPRPLGRRNLDPILAAVGEPLRRRRQIVGVPRGKPGA